MGDAEEPSAAPRVLPEMPQARLVDLLAAVEDEEEIVVLAHDNPDPDALASAAALGYLLRTVASLDPTLAFGGIVGRSENRALIQELGVEFERIEGLELPPTMPVALVDTQPRSGNNSFPAGRIASIVIDHHPLRADTTAATFTDVRPEYGASCSILVEYLRAAGLEPGPRLASALFYGIQSETLDLGREATEPDVQSSLYLYPRSDPAAISRIRHARVPPSYFRTIHEALAVARRHGTVVAVPLGRLDYPDMVAEVADLFLQMSGVEWTVAAGRYRDQLLLSLRTYDSEAHAGRLVREAIGDRGSAGGHGTFAGGQLGVRSLNDDEVDELRDGVLRDILEALGVGDEEPEPIVPAPAGGGAGEGG